MKILMVSHEYPPVGGGGANACMYLSKYYAKQGHSVTIITTNYHDLPERENDGNIVILRVRAKREHEEHCSFAEMLSYLVKALPAAKKEHKKERFDICQVFFGIPSGPIGYVLKKKTGLPYVIRFGGGDIPGFQNRFRLLYRLLAPFLKAVWNHADALVANSRGLQKLAYDFYDKKEVAVIANGVDHGVFEPDEEKPQDHTVHILFVSRLIERKGLQYVIPQLAKIQKACEKKIQLLVVGDGPYRAALEQIAVDTGAGDMVIFLGQKQKKELPEYYRKGDIFILPSAKEGMPNVVLEAMACGLPVVMTPCEGSDELIGDNGYVVSIDDFSKALIELCNHDEKRIRMGAESRRRVEQDFSWDKAGADYLEIFKRIGHGS